jgi:hypothetical protein
MSCLYSLPGNGNGNGNNGNANGIGNGNGGGNGNGNQGNGNGNGGAVNPAPPAPETPAETPAPETPLPETPAETPAPSQDAPVDTTPDSAPQDPLPETPAETPAPEEDFSASYSFDKDYTRGELICDLTITFDWEMTLSYAVGQPLHASSLSFAQTLMSCRCCVVKVFVELRPPITSGTKQYTKSHGYGRG